MLNFCIAFGGAGSVLTFFTPDACFSSPAKADLSFPARARSKKGRPHKSASALLPLSRSCDHNSEPTALVPRLQQQQGFGQNYSSVPGRSPAPGWGTTPADKAATNHKRRQLQRQQPLPTRG